MSDVLRVSLSAAIILKLALIPKGGEGVSRTFDRVNTHAQSI
jgi:hypothetical protein